MLHKTGECLTTNGPHKLYSPEFGFLIYSNMLKDFICKCGIRDSETFEIETMEIMFYSQLYVPIGEKFLLKYHYFDNILYPARNRTLEAPDNSVREQSLQLENF